MTYNYVELTEQEKARWAAVCSGIRAISQATSDGSLETDDLEAGFNQIDQIPIDLRRIIDSLHIPENAGEYHDDLVAILLRIPDGWGRWIGCNRGWYPIITQLNKDLAALAPDYEVHQVKEKYGTLRYYAELPQPPSPVCCDVFMAAYPRPTEQRELEKWKDLWELHCESPEHDTEFEKAWSMAQARRKTTGAAMDALIKRAEKASAVTCEFCGSGGGIMCVSRSMWYKTLCRPCADKFDYAYES